MALTYVLIFFLIIAFVLWNTIIIVPEREQCVVERLGKFRTVLNSGIHFLVPFFDRIAYVHEAREQVFDIPPQTCITQDNMQVLIDGLVYLKVTDAKLASYGIGDYKNASVNLAQTTMRSEVGKLTLSKAFSERDLLNEKIVREVDIASDSWGIKVLRYEIKNIRPSDSVISTLEKQMEAEREKRAEITLAEADKENRIILSEGERTESINISEGEKQKRINDAIGRGKEIELVSTATAEGIKTVANAINSPGGDMAVKLQLVEQFIGEVGKVMEKSKISIVPAEMANIKGFFEGASKVSSTIGNSIPGAR
mgnify:CR=1 FL=1